MSAPSVTFWPADLANRVVRSPVAVLRQAAGELTTMTGGLLEGQVTAAKDEFLGDDFMKYTLNIVAAGLDRYSVGLLTVIHRRDMPYPASVHAQELEYDDGSGDSSYPTCADDAQLSSIIRNVLQGERVRAILVSLLARLNDSSEESSAV